MSEGEIAVQIKVIVDHWKMFRQRQQQVPGLMRRLRESRGLSLRQFAKAIDVHHTWIEDIEKGTRQASLETLEKVLAYLEE